MPSSLVERTRDKLFANTYCIGEPPEVEIAIDYFFQALQSISQRNTQGTMYRIEQRPTLRQGGGMYFQASTQYMDAAAYQNVNGILRCVCAVQADDFDNTGRHCFSAYPLHVNFAFADNNLWQMPYAEKVVGHTLHWCERAFCIATGMSSPSDPVAGRFQLQEGAWLHGASYP
jgi:hypothetical protein